MPRKFRCNYTKYILFHIILPLFQKHNTSSLGSVKLFVDIFFPTFAQSYFRILTLIFSNSLYEKKPLQLYILCVSCDITICKSVCFLSMYPNTFVFVHTRISTLFIYTSHHYYVYFSLIFYYNIHIPLYVIP